MTKLSNDFEYNEKELTQEQIERIEAINKVCDATRASLDAQEAQRAEDYYNGVEDYCCGGICSQANVIARSRNEMMRNWRIEEVVRGYVELHKQVNVLKDLSGNVVASGIRNGKFGYFFVTNDGVCVSLSKKLSTFEKKGFVPYVVSSIEKAAIRQDRYGVPYLEGYETISKTEEISTEVAY